MAHKQIPLGSGFGPKTTAREVLAGVRLDGKVAIVTGGAAGLGLETTRALSEAGATVIVPARNVAKARDALAGTARVVVEAMDLLDPKSIDDFAKKFVASGRPLHALINNAGIMATPLERDARGYESQFAANHLGHFHLTARVWPALVKAPRHPLVRGPSGRRAVGARQAPDGRGASRRRHGSFQPQRHRRGTIRRRWR